MYRFVQAHPFATMVVQGERLVATHIPIMTTGQAEDFTLYGHIANHNEMLPHIKDGTEVLLIFQGAHGYVSSSWYKNKVDASTWDYSAVHINATVKLQSRDELRESVKKLTHHFEKDQENPHYYDQLPEKMAEDMLNRITGFHLTPTKKQAIAKLHQGYDWEDLSGILNNI